MLTSVLFDLDGTLLDTADDFLAIIRAMREESDLPAVANDLIRHRVSDGSAGMLAAAYSLGAEDPQLEVLRRDFLLRYERDLATHTQLYPGMRELLDWLDAEGLPWGVVTNKLSRFSTDIRLMFSMLRDYWQGNYREVPWKSIAAIAGALVYVLNPLDLIPDLLLGFGLLDDAGVVAACLALVESDLLRYAAWKDLETEAQTQTPTDSD